jgi:hypothetical protein
VPPPWSPQWAELGRQPRARGPTTNGLRPPAGCCFSLDCLQRGGRFLWHKRCERRQAERGKRGSPLSPPPGRVSRRCLLDSPYPDRLAKVARRPAGQHISLHRPKECAASGVPRTAFSSNRFSERDIQLSVRQRLAWPNAPPRPGGRRGHRVKVKGALGPAGWMRPQPPTSERAGPWRGGTQRTQKAAPRGQKAVGALPLAAKSTRARPRAYAAAAGPTSAKAQPRL